MCSRVLRLYIGIEKGVDFMGKSSKSRYKDKFDFVKLIPFFIMLIALLLIIGYSSLSENFVFNDIEVFVKLKTDIRITDVSVAGVNNGAISNYEGYNVSNVNGQIDLPFIIKIVIVFFLKSKYNLKCICFGVKLC